MLTPPFLLVDRYAVTEEIGRGGHAIVFRAHDRVLDREVAVKLLRDDALSADTLARFRQEVQVTSQLEHAHILHVYDTGAYEGRPFIVMELATGRTLAERLAREGQLPVGDAVQIARDVGYALAHAHARGVVHRDVKPENVLLSTSGAILADFGIARVTQELLTNKITSTGTAVGTVQYMSPEQLCAEPNVDARSDQYSLACVLYEMLAGVRPHIAATFEGLRLLRMTGRHVPVSAHRPSVPATVDVAIGRALSSLPADRYRSVEEFLVALGVGASGEFGVSGGWGVVGNSGEGGVARGGSGRVAAEARATDRRSEAERNTGSIFRRTRGTSLALAVAALVVLLAGAWYAIRGRAFGESMSASLASGEVAITISAVSASGIHDSLAAHLRTALVQEMGTWNGLRVVSRVAARDSQAIAIGATLVALTDSTRVRLTVQRTGVAARDVDSLVATRELTAPGPIVASLVRRALVVAVDSSVTSAETPGIDALPTRSWKALRAYARGFVELRAGQLDSASARFRESASASGNGGLGFAQAEFWAAQSGAWAKPRDVASWRPSVESAMRRGTLRGVDSLLAVGLVAISRAEFPQACEVYRAATVAAPERFEAWYQLGECQRLDSVVVKRPEGLRWRSSHWSALKAYETAVASAATSQWLEALFGRLMQVTYAAGGLARRGWRADSAAHYWALPELARDTIALIPVLEAKFFAMGGKTVPRSLDAALRLGRSRAVELTTKWIDRYPNSAAAWLAYSEALEFSGRIASGSRGFSADDALDRATSLKTSDAFDARISVTRTRLALRRGDFARARAVADSAIASASAMSREGQRILAPLAALVGDFASIRRFASAEFDELYKNAPSAIRDSLVAFDLRAATGECANLDATRAWIESILGSTSAPSEREALRAQYLWPPVRRAVPCLGVYALHTVPPVSPLDSAIVALSGGDYVGARAQLKRVKKRRDGASSAAISWDYLYAESWVLTQAGDTAGARKQIAEALDGVAGMSNFTLDYLAQASGLRRSIELLFALHAARPASGPASLLSQLATPQSR